MEIASRCICHKTLVFRFIHNTLLVESKASLEQPKPKPLGRFLAHYNLSIRYWDMGKAKQAIFEADLACEELRRHDISLGCAEHNFLVMQRVQARYKAEERHLLESVKRSPEAVEPNYRLGTLYFDKRMLLRAEAQLRYTQDRAKAACALKSVQADKLRASWLLENEKQRASRSNGSLQIDAALWQQETKKVGSKPFELSAGVDIRDLGFSPVGWLPDPVRVGNVEEDSWADAGGLRDGDEILKVNGRRPLDFERTELLKIALKERPLTIVFARPVLGLLDDLEDDLYFLNEERRRWCVEEEAGKTDTLQATGVRDGQRPQLLPCLQRRFVQGPEHCRDCDAWWAELCQRTDVDLCAMPNAEAPTPWKLRHGVKVRLCGFKQQVERNGMQGICQDWLADRGCWRISLDHGRDVHVKPEHLQVVQWPCTPSCRFSPAMRRRKSRVVS